MCIDDEITPPSTPRSPTIRTNSEYQVHFWVDDAVALADTTSYLVVYKGAQEQYKSETSELEPLILPIK